MFERAFQGSHRYSGSGLGLNLVRQIVEAHQGKVTVESELGHGSTFTIYLPLNRVLRHPKIESVKSGGRL
ncbi:MAG: HAMP domain-containing sensor histidine kinase [Thermosynechococcaceae cyanobacterium]